ncbi:hypothetical protein [Novosphingobium lentum]|uniref:hypothetical protein n=1 Tax=Novosphingobium lentum TaxID=145287 RepID=UPI000A9653BF|nr:hypothetical protein [Novosphingobium lentum]
MTADGALQIVGIVMALVIVGAGLRARNLRFETKAWMAVAWLVIILLAALVFRQMGW